MNHNQFQNTPRGGLLFAAVTGLSALACATENPEDDATRKSQLLTASEALTFDSANDWQTSGGTHSVSSTSTEGTGSIQVVASYYTELNAINLPTPSTVGDALSFDVRPAQSAGWGEIRVVASSSSKGFWQQLGSVQLSSLAAGQFQSVSIPLSSGAQQALSQSYSDLELQFIFNGSPGTYLIDNGTFGEPDTCEGCEEDTCNDEILNENETTVDCGGICGPCGAAAAGIVWYDKFTDGLGNWTTSGFSSAALVHDDDFAESGSGFPAATAQGTAILTSPPIDLTATGSYPLLRFHRLLDASTAQSAKLQIKINGNWQTIRNLGAEDAADNKWRTEFVQLAPYRTMTDFQFQFVTDGSQATFQVDDVSISERDAVDGSRIAPPSFFRAPGILPTGTPLAWKWRTDESLPWESAQAGPFDDSNWPVPEDEEEPRPLFLETTFNIDSSEDLNDLVLWARWDDLIEVTVNETLVYSNDTYSPAFQMIALDVNALEHGTNTIEVYARDYFGARFFDLGILRDPQRTFPEAVNPPELASGQPGPLAGFADRVKDWAITRDAPGVAFAVFKNGNFVVEGAYGYQDKAHTIPLQADPVMRLASADKSFKVAAAVQLIADSQGPEGFRLKNNQPLSRETEIFPLLREHYGFDATELEGADCSNDITLGHLMDHTSHVINFWEGGTGDFHSLVGTSSGRTTRHDNALYIYKKGCEAGKVLGSDPQYNNGGYMLLGYFLDVVTESGLQDYMWDSVQSDVFIDHEALLGRHSSEPWYETNEAPYNRWINFEHYTGLAATPRALAELATKYELQTGAIAPNGGVTTGNCVERNGGMSGTTAWAGQCPGNFTYAFIVNGGQENGSYEDLRYILRDYGASLSESDYQ